MTKLTNPNEQFSYFESVKITFIREMNVSEILKFILTVGEGIVGILFLLNVVLITLRLILCIRIIF